MNDLQLLLDFADRLDYEVGYCKNSDGTFTAFFMEMNYISILMGQLSKL